MRLISNHPNIQFVGVNSDYAAAQGEIVSLRPDSIRVEYWQFQIISDLRDRVQVGSFHD
jgi:hypothetical protein